jgi:hypothetical protein
MNIFRAPAYWEQLRNEMVGILEVMVSAQTEPVWEDVRKEAIERLYVKGVFGVVEATWRA